MKKYVVPEYHPLNNNDYKIKTDEKHHSINVIVPNQEVPTVALWGFDFDKKENKKDLGIEVQSEGVGRVRVKWKWEKGYNYKLVYCFDDLRRKEILTNGDNCVIEYGAKTEIVYVWLGYREWYNDPKESSLGYNVEDRRTYKPEPIKTKDPREKYLFEAWNCKAIYCIEVNEYKTKELKVTYNPLKESRAIEHGDIDGGVYGLDVDYISDTIFRISWDATGIGRLNVKINKSLGDKKDTKEYTLESGVNYMYVPLEKETGYDIYIRREQKGGLLSRFYFEIEDNDKIEEYKKEVSNVFKGELFQGNTVLAEMLDLFNEYAARMESGKFKETDLFTLTKELSLDDEGAVYRIKRAEMLKPINAFRGTFRDLQYVARVLSKFGLELYKVTRHTDKLKKWFEYGDENYVEAIRELNCFAGFYNNVIPATYFNIDSLVYDNNPQPCKQEQIDMKPCMFDALAKIDLLNFDGVVEPKEVQKEVEKLFNDRLYVCLILRMIAIMYSIQEKYPFEVTEELVLKMENYLTDDFMDLYCDWYYDEGTHKYNNNEPEIAYCNTQLEDTATYIKERKEQDNFLDLLENELYFNNECYYYDNYAPETYDNRNPIPYMNTCAIPKMGEECLVYKSEEQADKIYNGEEIYQNICDLGKLDSKVKEYNNRDGMYYAYDLIYSEWKYNYNTVRLKEEADLFDDIVGELNFEPEIQHIRESYDGLYYANGEQTEVYNELHIYDNDDIREVIQWFEETSKGKKLIYFEDSANNRNSYIRTKDNRPLRSLVKKTKDAPWMC